MSTAPTVDQLQRAFELLRRPDWPDSLAQLLTAARQVALVQGLAQRLANGQSMATFQHAADPAALTDQAAAPPLRAWDFPPRRPANVCSFPNRRRNDCSGLDQKRLAAGERDDD